MKGAGEELFSGITGIVTKPIAKTKEEGAKGFFKGLGSGLMGAITSPVTATLRAGSSITQGVASTADKLGDREVIVPSKFFRPRRYIGTKAVL